jgi:hypothetical protein
MSSRANVSPVKEREAQPGRRLSRGERQARQASPNVPPPQRGLRLARAAKLRESLQQGAKRQNEPAQGAVLPEHLVALLGRPRVASALEGALKRSEAPRGLEPLKRVEAQQNAARDNIGSTAGRLE